jgi:glycosyltransferase involved in cell wall biosynthesis
MASRILYVCGGRSFSTASLGRKLSGVAQCWRAMGHEVVHVCGGDIAGGTPSNDYGALRDHERWFRQARTLRPFVQTMSEWRDIAHDGRMREVLESLVRRQPPALIWERSCRLHCAGLTVARQMGVPYVLEWKDHLIPDGGSLFRGRAVRMERRKNLDADFLVVESCGLRDRLAEEGVDRSRILTAHNAVDVEEFRHSSVSRQEGRRALGIRDDQILIGYLGSYAFYHDAVRLVLATAILRDRGLKNVKILMMGAGQEYPATQQAAAERRLLDSWIVMKPAVPATDVPRILSSLDVAVLPGSTDIICPIKIQEYMAAGLAVIAPDYACNREVVTEGQTGTLFEPHNEEALADKMDLLARSNTLREHMGRAARREAEKRFTWEKTWGAALSEVLARTAAMTGKACAT